MNIDSQVHPDFLLILFRYADIIEVEVSAIIIEDLLVKRGLTKYRLAVDAGVPHATLNDICSGKTKLEKCFYGSSDGRRYPSGRA